MGSILLIINALFPFVVDELQQYKVVSGPTGDLISGIERAASSFATEVTSASSGTTLSVTATSLLAAVAAAVQVLQASTTISPKTLSIIAAFNSAIAAGVAASSITVVDPTALKPIAAV